MLTIFGGKITTFRKLAEEAVDLIAPVFNNQHGAWTANALLPGGDVYGARANNKAVLEFDEYVRELQQEYAWLPAALVERYARAYGTRIKLLLENRSSMADMGEEIATGLFAAEVEYLTHYEWATCTEDILWRRTKLGLHLTQGNTARSSLNHWLQELDQQ